LSGRAIPVSHPGRAGGYHVDQVEVAPLEVGPGCRPDQPVTVPHLGTANGIELVEHPDVVSIRQVRVITHQGRHEAPTQGGRRTLGNEHVAVAFPGDVERLTRYR